MHDPSQVESSGAPRPGGPIGGRWLAIGVAAAALAALSIVHGYVSLQSAEYAGILILVDHLFTLVAALLLLILCAACGRFILRRLGFDFDSPIDAVLFSTAIGSGAFALAMLVLGLASLFSTAVIGLLIVIAAIIVRRELSDISRLLVLGVSHALKRGDQPVYAPVAAAALAIVTIFMITQVVTPPADWDSLMYHLEIPRQFLAEGRIFVPPDNLHVAYIGLVHLLYVPLLAAGSPSAPAAFSALYAMLFGLATYSMARRFFDDAVGKLSLALLWAMSGLVLVAITPRLDVTLALFLLLAHYSLLISIDRADGRRYFFLAAALLGLAFGVKYHALAYGLALTPLVLWAGYVRAGGIRGSLRPLAGFAALALGAAAPWLAKNVILLGAPLYPFLAATQLEPWLAELYGGFALPAAVDPAVYSALAGARLKFNLAHLFIAPGLLTVEPEGAYYHTSPLFLLLPLWLVFVKDRTLSWLIVPAIIYLAIIVVPLPATNLRYLFPVVAPLTVVCVAIAVRSARRLFSEEMQRAVLVLVTVFALAPTVQAMAHWTRKSDVLGYFLGRTSEHEYLLSGFTYYRLLTRAVNRWVPSDGKVLLLFEARGFYLEPEVVQDNVLANWALVAPYAERDPSCLGAAGITHVLVSHLGLRYYHLRGADLRLIDWHRFPAFAARCLTPFYQGQGFSIYSVQTGRS